MALEIQGKVYDVFGTQQITEKFKKREFVLEVDDKGYIQYVKFQLNQDKCNIIDNYGVGDQVKVSFKLTGRPYTKKTGEKDYISNIVAWRIERADGSAPARPEENTMMASRSFELNSNEGEDDILPF
jgi:single-strand DNA-binding protein